MFDALDFQIVRWLHPGGTVVSWAGRRVVDPRITAHFVAAKVGVSDTAVRTRLRALRAAGCFAISELVPNPGLFGASVGGAEIAIPARGQVPQLLDRVGEVQGVLHARCVFDGTAHRLRVFYVRDGSSRTAERIAALAARAPTGRLSSTWESYVPPGPGWLSPSDWAMLRTMRAHPTYGIGELAEATGLGLKSTGRRFHRLLDTRACWYTPSPESEWGPCALVEVGCRDEGTRGRAEALLRAWPEGSAPLQLGRKEGGPGSSPVTLGALVIADRIASVDRLASELESLAGVESVRWWFTLDGRAFPTWWSEELDRAAVTLPSSAAWVGGAARALPTMRPPLVPTESWSPRRTPAAPATASRRSP